MKIFPRTEKKSLKMETKTVELKIVKNSRKSICIKYLWTEQKNMYELKLHAVHNNSKNCIKETWKWLC